jgi:hypothetical protein
MFSRKQILSSMAGMAMLALPVSAFAGNYDHWNHSRPNAWHERRLNNGFVKPQWSKGSWWGSPAQRAPINVASPAYRPYAWNRYHHQWFVPAPPDQASASAYQGYARPTYGYPPGASIGAANCNPAAVYSGSTASQSPSWLMERRYRAMQTIAQLRARGDSRGASRLVPTVKAFNQRIGGMNNQFGCRLAPTSSPASMFPYGNSSYNNGSYATNPTVNALSTIAVPMLSGIR